MSDRSRPDISVCIINWNTREHLRACLESLRSDRHACNVEVIVVDNGSADGSPEMVRRLFPHVRLLSNATNVGFAHANNQAARMAGGRNLLFLNSDTEVRPGALECLCDYLDAHADVGAVGPLVVGSDGQPQRSTRRLPTPAALLHGLSLVRATGVFHLVHRRYRRDDYDPTRQREVEVLMGAALCMPADVAKRLGGWDPGYAFGMEDADLCLRLGRTHRLVFVPDAVVLHHGRASSRLNSRFVYRGYLCGIVRYLHAVGHPRVAGLYKFLWMLDWPFAAMQMAVRVVWRRWGKRDRVGASKTLVRLQGLLAFARHDWRCLLQACSRPSDRPSPAVSC